MKALRLKQKVEFIPKNSNKEDNEDSLKFTIYKPGSPMVILETPNVEVFTQHGLLNHDMIMLPKWHIIPNSHANSHEKSHKKSEKDEFIKPKLINSESSSSYDVNQYLPIEFCGYDRDVGVLLNEGYHPKNKKEIITIMDRRIAYFTKLELYKTFPEWFLKNKNKNGKEEGNGNLTPMDSDIASFNGGYIFLMLELHLPGGQVDGWNKRYFIQGK